MQQEKRNAHEMLVDKYTWRNDTIWEDVDWINLA
jgi:hypothetical protein